ASATAPCWAVESGQYGVTIALFNFTPAPAHIVVAGQPLARLQSSPVFLAHRSRCWAVQSQPLFRAPRRGRHLGHQVRHVSISRSRSLARVCLSDGAQSRDSRNWMQAWVSGSVYPGYLDMCDTAD